MRAKDASRNGADMARVNIGRTIAVIACTGALTGLALPAAAAPGQASPAVPADRAYPVLADGLSSSNTGWLTEFGPSSEVSLKVKDPGAIAVTPNGKFAYVVTSGGIAVIEGVNTAHPKLARTVKTGGTPGGVALTPNGADVYVTVSSSKRSVIKAYKGASTGKLVFTASVATRPGAGAIAITPDGKYAYVAVTDVPVIYTLTEIGGIGSRHLKVVANISVPGYPEAITVTPNGRYVYLATNMGIYGATLIYKNAETSHPASAGAFEPPGNVGSVAVAPDGRWGYMPYVAGKLLIIKNPQTGPKKDGTVKVPLGSGEMVMQRSGSYAFDAVDGTSGGLAVLTGTASGHPKVASTWKLTYFPFYVAISPVR